MIVETKPGIKNPQAKANSEVADEFEAVANKLGVSPMTFPMSVEEKAIYKSDPPDQIPGTNWLKYCGDALIFS